MFKKILKSVVGGAAALAMSTSMATPVTVLGVSWDTDAPLDFSAFSLAVRQFISGTGEVSGFGVVSSVNGAAVDCAGCELTFQFSGFTPSTAGALPGGVGTSINYSGGIFNVYVDYSPEVNPFNPVSMTAGNTGDGALFLSLTGHQIWGTSFTGTVTASGLSGLGQLDVIGGAAQLYLDTNTKVDGSDLTLSSSFTSFIPLNNLQDAVGTGNLAGDSVAVPAPLLPALLGLGLIGLGMNRRRK